MRCDKTLHTLQTDIQSWEGDVVSVDIIEGPWCVREYARVGRMMPPSTTVTL